MTWMRHVANELVATIFSLLLQAFNPTRVKVCLAIPTLLQHNMCLCGWVFECGIASHENKGTALTSHVVYSGKCRKLDLQEACAAVKILQPIYKTAFDQQAGMFFAT